MVLDPLDQVGAGLLGGEAQFAQLAIGDGIGNAFDFQQKHGVREASGEAEVPHQLELLAPTVAVGEADPGFEHDQGAKARP